jgi:hypothetical protein
MKLKARPTSGSGDKRWHGGFTLAEVLAALVFMAIVIPVSIEGIRIANRAGVVSQRKAIAVRLGENVLNELMVTGQWQGGNRSGTFPDAPTGYRWELRNETWQRDSMRLLTLEVTFLAQEQEYNVELSTLVDSTQAVQQQEETQQQEQTQQPSS